MTKKGQFVTSLHSIAKNSGKGISIQNVRSSLKRFEKMQFLTNESTKQGRLITILNWELYQKIEKESTNKPTKRSTKSQQRANKEPTTKEECNNVIMEEDNKKNKQKKKYGEYKNVVLKEDEYNNLLNEWGISELSRMIILLDEGIEMKGYKYKNHSLALRKWKKRESDDKKQKPQGRQINESSYDDSVEMGF